MKKALWFLSCFGFQIFTVAQNTPDPQHQLHNPDLSPAQKYDLLLKIHKQDPNSEMAKDEKARLSSFAGNIPVFMQSDDARANRSANVTAIQNGTLPALNNVAVEGTGLNILVMDGGRIFEKHNEFGAVNGVVTTPRITDEENGARPYAAHATNVAGIIGAIGIGNFSAPYGTAGAKGVLPKVSFNGYSFYTTPLGNNYQKLRNANANISNHSYGINLGWTYVSTTSATYPQVGYYWIGNYEMNAQDTYSGSYATEDASFDDIIWDNPNQIVIKSTGNYYGIGPSATDPKFYWDSTQNQYVAFPAGAVIPPANCSGGYYCIGWGSLAKNIIGVGAANQLTTANNIYTTPTDVVKASYSSAGPRRDGAVKPDISAVGSNMLVANYTTGTSYGAYATGSGTSYAAPMIAGISGALTEIQRNLSGNSAFTFKADEMKAILTHTANEAGNIGPDVWFGWGFADATKAAELLIAKNQNQVIFERNNLTSGSVFTKEFIAGTLPIKASISWIDPAATPFTSDNDLQNNHTTRIVNDLDLRIVDTVDNSVYYPYKLDVNNPMAAATTGDNTVDNVEQINITAPVEGRKYRIEISAKNPLVDDNGTSVSQDYALIVTGYDYDARLATSDVTTKTVSVYPARTKDLITVLIPEGAKQISMYDVSGKNVLSVAAKTYQTIDVSQLPNGVYFVNILTEKGNVIKKIIKE